jgi:hypothetical protein
MPWASWAPARAQGPATGQLAQMARARSKAPMLPRLTSGNHHSTGQPRQAARERQASPDGALQGAVSSWTALLGGSDPGAGRTAPWRSQSPTVSSVASSAQPVRRQTGGRPEGTGSVKVGAAQLVTTGWYGGAVAELRNRAPAGQRALRSAGPGELGPGPAAEEHGQDYDDGAYGELHGHGVTLATGPGPGAPTLGRRAGPRAPPRPPCAHRPGRRAACRTAGTGYAPSRRGSARKPGRPDR